MYRRLTAIIALLAPATLEAQKVPDLTPYLIADRGVEVALARSAAPRQVSDSATVLVLMPNGFVQAVRGTNGFTCVVLRSFSGRLADSAFWNPRVRAPHCFNRPAVRTVLPAMMRQVAMVLSGAAPGEIAAHIKQAYASGEFPAPAPGAMAFMLSPRQYLQDEYPPWLPHLMFYYAKSSPAAEWGAGGPDSPVIDGSAEDRHSQILTLLIPVRQWSDGTAALAVPGE